MSAAETIIAEQLRALSAELADTAERINGCGDHDSDVAWIKLAAKRLQLLAANLAPEATV